jgi:hypothetical protein
VAFSKAKDGAAIATCDLLLICPKARSTVKGKLMEATNQDRIITLTINYTNGKQQQFEFIPPEVRVGEQANLGTRLHKLLTADPIIIELADKLLVIPVHNIQSIEISPVPPKLPDGVIHPMREVKK